LSLSRIAERQVPSVPDMGLAHHESHDSKPGFPYLTNDTVCPKTDAAEISSRLLKNQLRPKRDKLLITSPNMIIELVDVLAASYPKVYRAEYLFPLNASHNAKNPAPHHWYPLANIRRENIDYVLPPPSGRSGSPKDVIDI
jgi:hypothetical protein